MLRRGVEYMFEIAEVGSQVSKEEYEAQVPHLRVNLINAQYDLRNADFPILVLIVGDDQQGCNEVLNLLHEWMDARYLGNARLRPTERGGARTSAFLALLAYPAA